MNFTDTTLKVKILSVKDSLLCMDFTPETKEPYHKNAGQEEHRDKYPWPEPYNFPGCGGGT